MSRRLITVGSVAHALLARLARAGLLLGGIAALVGVATAADTTPIVHRQVGDARSYFTNAWWLESPQGLVLIDTMMLKSDAQLLVAAMKATGKPLAAIFITHPHGDHFGGAATVQRAFGKVPLVATQGTADGIVRTHTQGMQPQGWLRQLGDDFDALPPLPDRIVADGDRLSFAGMHFVVHDLGAGEAEDNVVIHNTELDVLFSGDVTVSRAPYYVGEGQSRRALAQLDRLARAFSTVRQVYSGHFEPRPLVELVAENRNYIHALRQPVMAALADPRQRDERGALTRESRRRLLQQIADLPGVLQFYGLSARRMAAMNLPGLEQEIRAERAACDPAWRDDLQRCPVLQP